MIKSLVKAPVTLVNKYTNALITSPYKTKMATTGFTYFLADYICQSQIEKKQSDDYCIFRSIRQGSVGAFFAAPSLHLWHSVVLPKLVKGCTKNVTRIACSVVLNETLFATYFISFLLFSFESLKTRSLGGGAQNVQEKFVPAFSASIKFWTWISLINYSFIPVHLRPVFVSCWSVVWQSYLSYISNNMIKDTQPALAEELGDEVNYYKAPAPEQEEEIIVVPALAL